MRAFCGVLAVMLSVLGAGCTSTPAPAPGPGSSGLRMAVQSAKNDYGAGEPIALSLVLTNRTAEDCRVSTVPDGAVVIVGMTRDNTAVIPQLTEGSYPNGFSAHLAAHTASLAPNATHTISWRSEGRNTDDDRAALRTSTVDSENTAAMSFWPVGEAGAYAVSVRYVSAEPGPCQATGDPVTVTFTVRGN